MAGKEIKNQVKNNNPVLWMSESFLRKESICLFTEPTDQVAMTAWAEATNNFKNGLPLPQLMRQATVEY